MNNSGDKSSLDLAADLFVGAEAGMNSKVSDALQKMEDEKEAKRKSELPKFRLIENSWEPIMSKYRCTDAMLVVPYIEQWLCDLERVIDLCSDYNPSDVIYHFFYRLKPDFDYWINMDFVNLVMKSCWVYGQDIPFSRINDGHPRFKLKAGCELVFMKEFASPSSDPIEYENRKVAAKLADWLYDIYRFVEAGIVEEDRDERILRVLVWAKWYDLCETGRNYAVLRKIVTCWYAGDWFLEWLNSYGQKKPVSEPSVIKEPVDEKKPKGFFKKLFGL